MLQKKERANLDENESNSLYIGFLDALKSCNKQEEEMDQVIRSAKLNYQFKASTNGLLVIIGTILLASPILFTWMKTIGIITLPSNDMDLTHLNYFLGGIGIVAFTTTFFRKPQQNMTEAIGDLAQLNMICIMFKLQYKPVGARLLDIIKKASEQGSMCDQQDIKEANDKLYEITDRATKLVDNYIKKYVIGK